MNPLFLLISIILTLAASAQTKTVVVLPSKDTTVVSFTASANTPTISISSSITVKPVKPVVDNPPPDTTTPPPAGYTQSGFNGFNTTSDLTNNNGQYGNGTIATDPEHRTEGAGSFYSRPANVSGGVRSEWQTTASANNPSEGAIEYDVKYEVFVSGNGHSLQWHPNTSGGSGSPRLEHTGNGKFSWVNWKGGSNTYFPVSFTVQTNRWYKFRIEYKFGSNGYIRHYIDGNKVFEKTGIQVGDNSGFYLKLGWNSWGSDGASSRIYFDNLKIFKKN